jgi:hypothetical protein
LQGRNSIAVLEVQIAGKVFEGIQHAGRMLDEETDQPHGATRSSLTDQQAEMFAANRLDAFADQTTKGHGRDNILRIGEYIGAEAGGSDYRMRVYAQVQQDLRNSGYNTDRDKLQATLILYNIQLVTPHGGGCLS